MKNTKKLAALASVVILLVGSLYAVDWKSSEKEGDYEITTYELSSKEKKSVYKEALCEEVYTLKYNKEPVDLYQVLVPMQSMDIYENSEFAYNKLDKLDEKFFGNYNFDIYIRYIYAEYNDYYEVRQIDRKHQVVLVLTYKILEKDE